MFLPLDYLRCAEWGWPMSRVIAIWPWVRRRNSAPRVGLRLRIDPPSLRDSLRKHLEIAGCLVNVRSSNEIEAQLLNSVSERHDHRTLVGELASWERAHSAARVELVAAQAGSASRTPGPQQLVLI